MKNTHSPNEPLTLGIVTPSFNQCRFLEMTLKSVIGQQRQCNEYIVMDGGSTDGSVELIKAYERHLTSWTSGPDGGQSEAINNGFLKCKSDIVGWLNSDDVYLPGAFDAAMQVFENDPDVVLVYGDYIKIDADNRVIALRRQPEFDYELCRYAYLTIPQPASFFRRDAVVEAGLLRTDFHYSLDYEFFLRITRLGKVVHLPSYLAAFRVHAESKSVIRPKRAHEEHEIIADLYCDRQSSPGGYLRKKLMFKSLLVAKLVREGCIPSRFGFDSDREFSSAIRNKSPLPTLIANLSTR